MWSIATASPSACPGVGVVVSDTNRACRRKESVRPRSQSHRRRRVVGAAAVAKSEERTAPKPLEQSTSDLQRGLQRGVLESPLQSGPAWLCPGGRCACLRAAFATFFGKANALTNCECNASAAARGDRGVCWRGANRFRDFFFPPCSYVLGLFPIPYVSTLLLPTVLRGVVGSTKYIIGLD
jgi:hypothetical protein